MSNTTKANVILIAPELSTGVDDALFDLILADVALEVSSAGYGAKQEQAQRYLAAHYITLSKGTEGAANSGAVKKEKVGEVEIEYSDGLSSVLSGIKATRYDETKYGRIFKGISRTAILPMKVYTP
jgi:hypothetical protein